MMLRPLLIFRTSMNPELNMNSRGIVKSPLKEMKPKNNNSRPKRESKYKSTKYFGLDRKERKDLRKRLIENQMETKPSHPFKQLYPWSDKLKFAEHLKGSQIYNQDGLIALCKPYGISKSGLDNELKKDSIVNTIHKAGQSEYYYSLQDVIPLLKEMYEVDTLEIVKTCERWSSGIVLLSSNKKTREKVEKSISRAKPGGIAPYSYLAVTIGKPLPENFNDKAFICLDNVKGIGNVPVIRNKTSKLSIKRQEVRANIVKHSVLHNNDKADAALIQINTQIQKWHFLRVWMAYSYSPILGDNIYNGRVKTLAGKRIQVSSQNLTSYNPISLPAVLENKLGIPENASEIIPCHLHLHEVTLPGYLSKKEDLIIKADTPSYFNWTCEQLGLSNPYLILR